MFGNFCCHHWYGWPEWMYRARAQVHIGRQYWHPCRKLLCLLPRQVLKIGSIMVRSRWKKRRALHKMRRAM